MIRLLSVVEPLVVIFVFAMLYGCTASEINRPIAPEVVEDQSALVDPEVSDEVLIDRVFDAVNEALGTNYARPSAGTALEFDANYSFKTEARGIQLIGGMQQASNLAQGFRVAVNGFSVMVMDPHYEGEMLTWFRLANWGPVSSGIGHISATRDMYVSENTVILHRAVYQAPEIIEVYHNTPRGIEHRALLPSIPAAGEKLRLQVSTDAGFVKDIDLIPAPGKGIRIFNLSDREIRYEAVSVVDSTGREVPAHLKIARHLSGNEFEENSFYIEIDNASEWEFPLQLTGVIRMPGTIGTSDSSN